MATSQSGTVDEARANQVAPEIRAFVQDHTIGFARLERFETEHETNKRGYAIEARTINLRKIPDGFKPTRSMLHHGNTCVYIRPE